MTARAVLRLLLAAAYVAAGAMHFAAPRPFVAITPDWVPEKGAVVALTGAAEILGALALAQPWSAALRRAGGVGLALYAACVFPANINHLLIDMGSPAPALGWAYHGPRMLLQPVLIWLALWTSGAIDWPIGRARR
jgi:uncharacterized membrane protein